MTSARLVEPIVFSTAIVVPPRTEKCVCED
jgi:hypothetical protein